MTDETQDKLEKELEEKEKEGKGGGILRRRTFGEFYGYGGGGLGDGFGGFGGGGRESEYGSGIEGGRFEEIGRGQGFESGGGGLYDGGGGLFDGGFYGGGREDCGGYECRYIDKRGGEGFDGEFSRLFLSSLTLSSTDSAVDLGGLYNDDLGGGYFDQQGRFHKLKLKVSQDNDRFLDANDRSHHFNLDKDQALDSKKYNEVNFEKENENKDEDAAKLAIDLEKLREEEELKKKEKEEGGDVL